MQVHKFKAYQMPKYCAVFYTVLQSNTILTVTSVRWCVTMMFCFFITRGPCFVVSVSAVIEISEVNLDSTSVGVNSLTLQTFRSEQ